MLFGNVEVSIDNWDSSSALASRDLPVWYGWGILRCVGALRHHARVMEYKLRSIISRYFYYPQDYILIRVSWMPKILKYSSRT